MADTLLIVHGYSDGSTSFTALRDFFVGAGAYTRERVFFVDYTRGGPLRTEIAIHLSQAGPAGPLWQR